MLNLGAIRLSSSFSVAFWATLNLSFITLSLFSVTPNYLWINLIISLILYFYANRKPKLSIAQTETHPTTLSRIPITTNELLEATNLDSPIAKFIQKKGEGIHHIAFAVTDIYSEITRLKSEGFIVLNDTPKKGADNKLVVFLHPKSSNGVLVELCQDIE